MSRRREFANPADEWNADNRDYDPDELVEQITDILKRVQEAPADVYDRAHAYFASVSDTFAFAG